jgi:signal transduction histidine kinase
MEPSIQPGSAAQPAALLAWIHDLAPHGIFTTDPQLRIQWWNQWMEVHSGLTAEAVLGRHLFEIFPDLATRRLDGHFKRALTGEVSVLATALHDYLLPFPPTLREADMPHMLQTARIGPLLAGEEVLGTITVIEDVTQREFHASTLRRQHAEERLLSWALAHLLQSKDQLRDIDALFPRVATALKLELYTSMLLDPGASQLRLHSSGGLTPEEQDRIRVLPLGESLCGLSAQLRQPILLDHVQTSHHAHAAVVKDFGVRAYAGFPLVLGDTLLGTLSFATRTRDTLNLAEVEFLSTIAQYVAIALDRAERHQQLEVKVTERTARLNETISQLESFSYTLAHDLRAPIRALKGYCEVLMEDFASALPEAGRNILTKLLRASNRMDSLTRDLLKLSKLSQQEVELTPVDTTELVQDILLLTPELQNGVLIVSAPLGQVWAQRTLLQQCLSNLFDNALKFMPAKTKPMIKVRAESRLHGDQPCVRLWIEDNGIGIEPDQHGKIFGIFERVGGPDAAEGTGIGLAIVARAVKRMGGTCGVVSALGRGSQFWLELKAAPQAPTGGIA